jgi:hypothetical protein
VPSGESPAPGETGSAQPLIFFAGGRRELSWSRSRRILTGIDAVATGRTSKSSSIVLGGAESRWRPGTVGFGGEGRSGFCSVFSQSLTEPSACIRSDGLVQSYSRSSRGAAAALSAGLSKLVVLAAVASS